MGGQLDDFGTDLPSAAHQRAATHRRTPAPVRSHAEGNAAGVPVNDFDVLIADPELVGNDLSERGLMTLTVGVRTGEDRDFARGMDPHHRAFPETYRRPQRARHSRRGRAARLNASAHPNTDQPAFLPG